MSAFCLFVLALRWIILILIFPLTLVLLALYPDEVFDFLTGAEL